MLQELNTFEMNEIKGGGPVTQEEYCAILSFLFKHNYEDVWTTEEQDAWHHAHGMYCLEL